MNNDDKENFNIKNENSENPYNSQKYKNEFIDYTFKNDYPINNNLKNSNSSKSTKIYISAIVILLILLISSLAMLLFKEYKYSKNNSFMNLIPNKNENSQITNDNLPKFNYGEASLNIENPSNNENYLSAEQIYSSISPSVVGIVIYDQNSDITSDPKGEGSGIVMSENGYIITNSHVIGDSKNYRIKVVLSTGQEYPASVVGYDTRTDLAVIKIDASNLSCPKFGNSDNLSVGNWVIAIGNPGGLDFANSLTRGCISALNRSVGSSQSLVKYIQTDAAINPGNSGGALINMYGQVIGINTSKIVSPGYEGIGFAIPINTVKSIVDDLINHGYVSNRVKIGISGKVVTNYQSQIYKVPQGIIIVEINDNSSLSQSDVKPGDIITKINSISITGFDVLYSELTKYKEGEKVTLTIYRPSNDLSPASTFDVKITLLSDKGENQK